MGSNHLNKAYYRYHQVLQYVEQMMMLGSQGLTTEAPSSQAQSKAKDYDQALQSQTSHHRAKCFRWVREMW